MNTLNTKGLRDQNAHKQRRPYDHRGRFVPTACPECDNGDLRHQGGRSWLCDGLADPGHPNKDLVACNFSHENGAAYPGPSRAAQPSAGTHFS